VLAVSLVFASMAGLLACPQLLSDDFDSLVGPGDDSCARRQTCAGAGGSSGAGALTAGSGGTTSGTGGSEQNAGASGAAGAGSGGSSEAGSGGTAGDGMGGSSGTGGSSLGGNGGTGGLGGTSGSGTGGSDQADASVDPPDCWVVKLDDSVHVASDNCLGIKGWNDVVNGAGSDVDNSYEDDDVCLAGTVSSDDWGAVYNLTLNDPDPSDEDVDPWDAAALGVGGFQLEMEGESLPPEIQVKYTDASSGDYCRVITPASGMPVSVPFANAHPGCATSSSSVTDASDLTFIRLVFPPEASDYDIDFCLSIRAIP
jgi:hypothetical protein